MENENKTSKKREWIKNIAIIFLSVLLVLTFFSNTVMNYSLPQVATQYVMNNSISNTVRGTGIVEAVDPYDVMVYETRTIKSVSVQVDSYVEKGDVLYVLEDVESEELTQAENDLTAARLEYDKQVLNGGISATRLKEIEAGKVQPLETSQGQVSGLQTKIDELQKSVDDLTHQISILEQSSIDASAESAALSNAQIELNNARVELSKKQAAYDALADRADDDAEKIAAKEALDKAQEKVWKLEAKVANAQIALEQKLNSPELANQIKELQKQKIDKESELNATTAEKEKVLAKVLLELDVYDAYLKMSELKEKVEDLKEKSVGATITAPVAGKINSLTYKAGQQTVPDESAAVIQADGKGMMLTFTTGIKQAATIRIGDEVTVENAWYYGDIKASLTAIRTDKENPRESKELVFEVGGADVAPGDSLTLSVGQRSMEYSLVVPNVAVREDNNGKFILIVESKSAPFGNRYIARRVDVEIVASDDINSAVKGNLEGYEYVITNSTKPIEDGDQVRLAEGMN